MTFVDVRNAECSYMKLRCSRERHGKGVLFLLGLLRLTSTIGAQTSVPRPDHVVIVVEEYYVFDRIYGALEARYMNDLAERVSLFVAVYALTHPSQPNYLAL